MRPCVFHFSSRRTTPSRPPFSCVGPLIFSVFLSHPRSSFSPLRSQRSCDHLSGPIIPRISMRRMTRQYLLSRQQYLYSPCEISSFSASLSSHPVSLVWDHTTCFSLHHVIFPLNCTFLIIIASSEHLILRGHLILLGRPILLHT